MRGPRKPYPPDPGHRVRGPSEIPPRIAPGNHLVPTRVPWATLGEPLRGELRSLHRSLKVVRMRGRSRAAGCSRPPTQVKTKQGRLRGSSVTAVGIGRVPRHRPPLRSGGLGARLHSISTIWPLVGQIPVAWYVIHVVKRKNAQPQASKPAAEPTSDPPADAGFLASQGIAPPGTGGKQDHKGPTLCTLSKSNAKTITTTGTMVPADTRTRYSPC